MPDLNPSPIRSNGGQFAVPGAEPRTRVPGGWPAALRALREAHGVSQPGWAALLGVSEVTVRRWERGVAVPTAQMERALVELCHEHHLFQTYRSGPLAGGAFTPELLRDLLAEARLAHRPPAEGTPAPFTVIPVTPVLGAPKPAPALPTPLTRLIGREAELGRVCALLDEGSARLITLTGPGGAGKTRLGLAAARGSERYQRRVWFVRLESVREPALVLGVVARALGVDDDGQQALAVAIGAALGDTPALVVLDNFEQLLAAATDVAELLTTCPALTCLVTSRAALRIPGEIEVPVAPLALPPTTKAAPTDAVAGSPAVQLFVERAAAVRPDFILTAANADTVAQICARLDGLPLAIELAAMWIKVLTPAALRDRLARALPLLDGTARGVSDRQRTLRGAISWSYTLLDTAEQALFRRLSVFRGGWTLDAAEAALAGDAVAADDVLTLLAQLAGQSLVIAADGAARFTMLETVREFAAEKLAEAGEDQVWRRRHRAWCLALAEQADTSGAAGLDRLAQEHDNLRAALSMEESGEADEAEQRLQLVARLWRFWQVRGFLAEGRRRIDEALAAAPGATPQTRARVLNGAGSLAYYQADFAAARDYYQAALIAREAAADQRGALAAASNLAMAAYQLNDIATAVPAWERSLALAREQGDERGAALALGGLSLPAQDDENHNRARSLLEEAHVIWEKLGDTVWLGRSFGNLAIAAYYAGDMATARTFGEKALAISSTVGNIRSLTFAYLHLARVAIRTGEMAVARRYLGDGLAGALELGDQYFVALHLEAAAYLAAAERDATAAARFCGAADGLRVVRRMSRTRYMQRDHDAHLVPTQALLPEQLWNAAWQEGHQWTETQALDAVRALLTS